MKHDLIEIGVSEDASCEVTFWRYSENSTMEFDMKRMKQFIADLEAAHLRMMSNDLANRGK